MAPEPKTLIIGGGLAGIAAAVRLAQHGIPVTLVETRKRLGGRATSFTDADTGKDLDNCQHVVMRCCTNLLDLYQKLGVADLIEWHKRFYFCDAQGRFDVLEADDLPAPFHLAQSILAFQTLTWREKLAMSLGMRAVMQTDRSLWRDRSFAGWLEEHQQPAGVVEKFWRPVVVGAINEWPERMSAEAALQVFQEGFLAHEDASWMGLSRVPLVRLYDQAQEVIAAAGGQVILRASASHLVHEQGRIMALELDRQEAMGGELRADAFISALPFDRLAKLTPPELVQLDQRLQHLDEFEVSPIIGIHLWVEATADQPAFTLPHLSFMQSPLHWVFNKGFDEKVGGQHLHGVISAAHDLVAMPAAALAQMAMDELGKAIPAMRESKLLDFNVIKEKRATFSAQPGIDRIRPGARGSIANLYLAGDWCATGWPATMEGAVRSGYLAAQALLEDRGLATGAALVPDLPASVWYQMARRF